VATKRGYDLPNIILSDQIFWVFPFLNVYEIFRGETAQTDVTLLQPVGFEKANVFWIVVLGLGHRFRMQLDQFG
jgi:hypothetical protein